MRFIGPLAKSMTTWRRLFSAAFVFCVASVIVLSVLPQRELPTVHLSDKLAHVAAYVAVALTGGAAFPGRRFHIKLGLGLIGLGCLLEVIQAFVPGREPSALDAAANTLGITLGQSLVYIVSLVQRRITVSMEKRTQ